MLPGDVRFPETRNDAQAQGDAICLPNETSPPSSKLALSLPSASARLEGDQQREPAPGLTFQRSPANGKKKKAPTERKAQQQQKGNSGEHGGCEAAAARASECLCRQCRHFAPKLLPSPGRAAAVSNESNDPPQREFFIIFFPLPQMQDCFPLPNTLQGLGMGNN